MNTNRYKKIYIAIFLFWLSISIGFFGFRFIEHYQAVDALYMTVITISTVGFETVKELSSAGKIFVSFYIMFNLCILAYIVSVVSRYLFEGELRQLLSDYIIDKGLKKMENHVIICGYGRNGFRACQELEREGYEFIVVDISEENLKAGDGEGMRYKHYIGDATNENTLKAVNIDKARALITAVPDDATNVFVTLTARELNKKIDIIARATQDSSISKLYTAGATKVVLPDNIGGRYMADLITKPQVIDFLDTLSGKDGDMKLVNVDLQKFKKEFQNIAIKNLQARNKTGVNILGYKKPNEEYIFNPSLDLEIGAEGILMILGTSKAINLFFQNYTTIK